MPSQYTAKDLSAYQSTRLNNGRHRPRSTASKGRHWRRGRDDEHPYCEGFIYRWVSRVTALQRLRPACLPRIA